MGGARFLGVRARACQPGVGGTSRTVGGAALYGAFTHPTSPGKHAPTGLILVTVYLDSAQDQSQGVAGLEEKVTHSAQTVQETQSTMKQVQLPYLSDQPVAPDPSYSCV